ncbi:MAG: LysR family transcriptional regulator, partial [Oscillospiraceae bacterium]|nr:LysR family transcriptional regulator [Oscillospiraceae bacterium]
MNSNQIKCFLALAETLNFTKAAARLYMTQPGLSHQIASLEAELKTQLFVRNQKRVLLTPAGALLAGELGALQEAGERLIERVQNVGQGYTGELNIGLIEGQWMGADLTDLFRDYMQKYPNIDLRICQGSFGELRRLLEDGKIDAEIS